MSLLTYLANVFLYDRGSLHALERETLKFFDANKIPNYLHTARILKKL
jgi:hypothetical protein